MYSSASNLQLIKRLKKFELFPLNYEQTRFGVIVNNDLLLRPFPIGVKYIQKFNEDWMIVSSYKTLIKEYCKRKMELN